MKVLVLGGTTEGRELGDRLAAAGVDTTVSVATAAGAAIYGARGGPVAPVGPPDGNGLPPGNLLRPSVRIGRLGRAELARLLVEYDILVDATHPYAVDASENARAACEDARVEYLRVVRPASDYTGCIVVETVDDAARAIPNDGNVLVTTGTKDIARYLEIPGWRDRVFVRVLNDPESIDACIDLGLAHDHVLVGLGPFTLDQNIEAIEAHAIRTLVTKDGGLAGGFDEKVEAARRCGVDCIVVARPLVESGLTVGEAFDLVMERCSAHIAGDPRSAERTRLAIVGIGMGGPGGMTAEAMAALADAQLVVGASRMLDAVRNMLGTTGSPMPPSVDAFAPTEILDAVARSGASRASVACSGDVGFFSLAQGLVREIAERDAPVDVDLIPGVSSPQCLAARLKTSWHDMHLVSAHGRCCDPVGEVLTAERVFFLTGGNVDANAIATALCDAGLGDVRFTVAEKLGYADEMVASMTATDAAGMSFDALACVLVEHGPLGDPAVAEAAGFSGIPDELFVRGNVPMTKREVRSLVTSALRPRPGSVVWDVGTGTGSVAIEVACLEPRCRVFGVDRNPEAIRLVEQNRIRFGAFNVTAVEGSAPSALIGLPAPDTVFIGGSTGSFEQIARAAIEANASAKIVATAVAVESIASISQTLAGLESEGLIMNAGALQIGAARARRIGSYHVMDPQSPVWVFEAVGSGDRPGAGSPETESAGGAAS